VHIPPNEPGYRRRERHRQRTSYLHDVSTPDRRARLSLALLLLPWLAAMSSACALDEPTAPRTNVILISLDTLGAHSLGAYGYTRETSPQIDALLAQSTVFTHAYTLEPHTLPAHTSLFTSLHPLSHGVEGRLTGGQPVPAKAPSLTSSLKQNGYTTAAFVNGGFLHPRFGLDRDFDRYDYYSDIKTRGQRGDLRYGRSAAQTNEALGRWLDEIRSTDAADASYPPFFLFLHYFDIHSDWRGLPYDSPEPYRAQLVTDATIDFEAPSEAGGGSDFLVRVGDGQRAVAQDDIAYIRSLYDAGIRYTDDRVGELLSLLGSRGLLENSLIVLVSDHGEEFMEHGKMLHTQLYEETMRIPFALHFPDSAKFPAGTRPELVTHLDVAPTVLSYLGIGTPNEMQGRDLMPALREQAPVPVEPIVLYSSGHDRLALVHAERKLLYDQATDHAELYALDDDPLEQVDLAPGNPDAVKEAIDRLRQAVDALPKPDPDRAVPGVRLDAGTVEELKALGYVR